MSRYHAEELTYQEVTLFGKPALFSECRINNATVPEGLYRYEIRHSDDDWSEPIELARGILVNFYGTVLTREPLQLPIEGWLPIQTDEFELKDGGCRTLAEFQKQYPSSEKEVIDFFTVNESNLGDFFFSKSEEWDRATGCVGHLRGDFGNGKQFYTTWHPHQNDILNTTEFATDLDRTMNWLREQPNSPLRDFDTMKRCCDLYRNACAIKGTAAPSYGFMVQTRRYVYMLRCSPIKGDYPLYMYCYRREDFERSRYQPQKDTRSIPKKRTEPER